MPRLTDYKVLTFDCYGTLIDWEAGIWDAIQPLLMFNDFPEADRHRTLATFAKLESRQQAAAPDMLYSDVLVSVHQQIAAHFDLQTNIHLDAAFGDSLPHWPAFPDSADALRYLKTRFKLVILSNVSRDGFAASNRKLGVAFDAIYTAEDVGSYKPAAANFEYLLNQLRSDFGLCKNDILHTAQSLFHDHVPANTHAIANAWIDRQRLSDSGSWGATAVVDKLPEYDFLFFSMEEMAQTVRQETS